MAGGRDVCDGFDFVYEIEKIGKRLGIDVGIARVGDKLRIEICALGLESELAR